jgi:hypothetical protein
VGGLVALAATTDRLKRRRQSARPPGWIGFIAARRLRTRRVAATGAGASRSSARMPLVVLSLAAVPRHPMRWMEKMRRLARTINRLGWFWSTRVKARAKTVHGLIQRMARVFVDRTLARSERQARSTHFRPRSGASAETAHPFSRARGERSRLGRLFRG